jgi:phosphohistidine swiveling domain-containing protein
MINQNDYIRLFRIEKMCFLIGEFWINGYKELGVMYTSKDGTQISYLPKDALLKTMKEGKEIYGTWQDYNKFKKKWFNYTKKVDICFKSLSDKISKKKLRQIVNFLNDFFIYYGKTEFIYVDAAFNLKTSESKRVINDFGYFKKSARKFANKVWFGNNSYFMKLVRILSNQFNIEEKDISDYSPSELFDLFDGNKVSRNILELRRKDYINAKKPLFGQEAKKTLNLFYPDNQGKTEFKGIIANKGKVTAKVWIIPQLMGEYESLGELLTRMPKGYVLLAETTSPDLLIACKKASAIITDQGGLLSHAAVISRELKIPCVVGLKDLINFVKNGDLIEVDANKGVIKIINSVPEVNL